MRNILLFLILATTASAGEVSGQRAAELENLVKQDCGACHGMTRKGGLGPDIRAKTLKGRDADGLAQIIRDGIPDTAMPPWGPLLADEDINWIAEYLLEESEE